LSDAGLPGEASDAAEPLKVLGWALDQLGARSARGPAEIAVLSHAYPWWAVWRPTRGGTWTMRPAGSVPPGPEVPMVWVRAGTAAELANLMQAADAQLPPGGD
jgi:hypothetical protein